jgi:hypothetical protein
VDRGVHSLCTQRCKRSVPKRRQIVIGANIRLASIGALLISFGVARAQGAVPQKAACAQTLPAGLVIRIEPDERIIAGKTDGPLLLTVTSDVRLFPGKPPLVPRFSKVFAKTVDSREAGRLWGRARYQLTLETLLTPGECEYPLEAKIIEAGKHRIANGAIIGEGHARRDFILTLFPPTTLYQLIRLPARGPKLALYPESTLAVRLMQPVRLEAEAPAESAVLTRVEPSAVPASTPVPAVTILHRAADCADTQAPDLTSPIQFRNGARRPVRNLTPYTVRLEIARENVATLGPCFISTINVPLGEFTIKAVGTVLEGKGQHEVPLDVVVNPSGTGWDVINRERSADLKPIASQ